MKNYKPPIPPNLDRQCKDCRWFWDDRDLTVVTGCELPSFAGAAIEDCEVAAGGTCDLWNLDSEEIRQKSQKKP